MNTKDYDDVLIPKNLQSIQHISRTTVYRLLETGVIKFIKVGKSYRIPKMNLADFMYPGAGRKEEEYGTK